MACRTSRPAMRRIPMWTCALLPLIHAPLSLLLWSGDARSTRQPGRGSQSGEQRSRLGATPACPASGASRSMQHSWRSRQPSARWVRRAWLGCHCCARASAVGWDLHCKAAPLGPAVWPGTRRLLEELSNQPTVLHMHPNPCRQPGWCPSLSRSCSSTAAMTRPPLRPPRSA